MEVQTADQGVHPPIKRQRKSKESRLDDFIQSATKVFAEKGFDAATIRDIAKEAGCSDGLLFRYFKSKSELLWAVIESNRYGCQRNVLHCLNHSLNVEEQIFKILEAYIEQFAESDYLFRLILSRALVDCDFKDFKNHFKKFDFLKEQKEHFQQRIHNSTMSNDCDLDSLVVLLYYLGFTIGFVRQNLIGGSRDDCLNIASEVTKIIVYGIK